MGKRGAHEESAGILLFLIAGELRDDRGVLECGAALHFEQARANDELEAHIGGSWVARQPEHRRAIDDAESLGFARTHVHGGHEQFACALHDGLDEVEVAV